MVDTLQGELDRAFARLGVTGQAAAVLMILFGVLIIVFPNLVAILIGLYLIVVGLLQLLGTIEANRARTQPAPPPPSTGPPPSYP
ncbi:MAG TPA: hypothetical protein VGR28_12905 [Candidatus Thermoplasmatota archaeon]|jgi:uncharacterized membrane protein HdeD (DUF308 family)|nr:hypothetical protein [Candidatus Thermoplasmatota archaeon]